MSKWADRQHNRNIQRLKRYAHGVKRDAVIAKDERAFGSWNIRTMWAEDGTPRIVGHAAQWYRGGRLHAHPPFLGRTGSVRTVKAPMA
jgi:hypothetical protein